MVWPVVRDQVSRSGPTEASAAVRAIKSPGAEPRSAVTSSSNSPDANVFVVGPISVRAVTLVTLPSFTRPF